MTTISDLFSDVLLRVPNASKGISLYQAANSVQSLIYKKLLDRSSDLLATGDLFAIIPQYDYMFTLPSDFVALIGRPMAVSAPDWLSTSAWMAGTVTSYNSTTKALVLDITSSNGSGSLSAWFIAVGVLPGQPIQTLDTSVTAVSVGIGAKTLTTVTALDLVPGQNVIISNIEIPTDTSLLAKMEPVYLTSDDGETSSWLSQNGVFDDQLGYPVVIPSQFKVIGTKFYVRPKPSGPIMITGKYKTKPAAFSATTDTIPFPLFYEVYKEGVIKIISTGKVILDVDLEFMAFFNREMDTVINARFNPLPARRIRRSAWL